MTTNTTRLLTAVALAGVLASGCAAMRREDAEKQGMLLAAAGFQVRPADTPARQADLQGVPPDKLLTHQAGDKVVFTYYDPDVCQCVYIGGPAEYQQFQKLALQKQLTDERREAAQAREDAAMEWGMWGPFWW